MQVKSLRMSQGLSVPALSRLSGVSVRTIEDLEKRESLMDKNDCKLSTAIALAKAFGVTLDALAGIEKEKGKNMTKEMVLANLEDLVGNEFDADEVICAFEDYEEDGVSEVIISNSSNGNANKAAYINTKNGTEFYFTVADDIITEVWM